MYPIKRLSYIVPYGVIGLVAYVTATSWWALAMLTGAVLYAWDWLWGDFNLLNRTYAYKLLAVGFVCIAASFMLAGGLVVSVNGNLSLGDHLPRRVRWLYRLPVIGVGITAYGLLILSRTLPTKDR